MGSDRDSKPSRHSQISPLQLPSLSPPSKISILSFFCPFKRTKTGAFSFNWELEDFNLNWSLLFLGRFNFRKLWNQRRNLIRFDISPLHPCWCKNCGRKKGKRDLSKFSRGFLMLIPGKHLGRRSSGCCLFLFLFYLFFFIFVYLQSLITQKKAGFHLYEDMSEGPLGNWLELWALSH